MLKSEGRSKTSEQWNSILKSAFARAGVNPCLESGNSMPPQLRASGVLAMSNTTLMERSAEENSDYFYNNLNADCICKVFNLFVEKKDLLISTIKVIREVCKMWKEIIDGISFGYGLLQQRFLVELTTIEQLAAFAYTEHMSGRNIEITSSEGALIQQDFSNINLALDECLKPKFVVDRKINTKINLISDYDITVLIYLIKKRASQLKNIETISFPDITSDNVIIVSELLKIIFLCEEVLFSSLKQLTFTDIDVPIKIPGFKCLETLIFKKIWSLLTITYCPALKKLEYKYIGPAKDINQIKEIVELRKMRFSVKGDSEFWFLQFIKGEHVSWLGCVETIVIDKIKSSKFEYAQELIDCIYSKQELFTNLKKIILDIGASKADLSKALILPKFLERIEVVCFTGSESNADATSQNLPLSDF